MKNFFKNFDFKSLKKGFIIGMKFVAKTYVTKAFCPFPLDLLYAISSHISINQGFNVIKKS